MNNLRRNEAHELIYRSVQSGKIKRPDKCEICEATERIWYSFSGDGILIVAHHWRGYDYPFDVWWICMSCNALLRGVHDGSLDKQFFISLMKTYLPLSRACLDLKLARQTLLTQIKKGKWSGAVQLSELLKLDKKPYNDPWFIPRCSVRENQLKLVERISQ